MIYPRWSVLESRLQVNHRNSLTGTSALTKGMLVAVWRRIARHIEVAHLWAEGCPNDKRVLLVKSPDSPASLGLLWAPCYGWECLSKSLDVLELSLSAIFEPSQVPTSTIMELRTRLRFKARFHVG
jgi:hypothetical protein